MFKPSIIIVIVCIIVGIGIAGLYGTYLHLSNTDAQKNLITRDDLTYLVGLDDADFPPLVIYGEGGEPTGFDVDLIHWVANEMKFNINFVPTPWDDIFTALEEQKIDMIMGGISITPGRLENYLFSDPYLAISQSVAIGEQATMLMDDFYAGRGIVGVEGGTTSDDLVTEILVDSGILPEEKLRRYEQIEVGAQDLASGDIQYLLSDWPVMVSLVQRFPIHIIGDIDTGEKYGIVIHKGNKELQQTLNTGLDQLTASYDWDALKHRYLLDY
jgi:polar amino acid transport system substrate-binding protein